MPGLTLPVKYNHWVRDKISNDLQHLVLMDMSYYSIQRDMKGILIDRTKAIDFYDGRLDFPNATSVPKMANPLSTEECIEDSVFQLCELADKHSGGVLSNKKIYVLWSGGIDSSTALLGIWRYARHLFNQSRVIVLHTESSTNESPFIYKWMLENNIQAEQVSSVIEFLKGQSQAPDSITNDNNNIYVTGELGDQIMGNFYNMGAFPLLNDEVNFLSKDVFSFLNPIEDKERKDSWYEFSRLIYDNRKTDIETVFDLLSWANFTCKYEHPKYRLWLSTGRKKPTYNFFDTYEFQNWAMNNNWREKCNGNWWTQYKMPWKKFIYDITGNDYALVMRKQASLVQDHGDQMIDRKFRYIDENFEVRSTLDESKIL